MNSKILILSIAVIAVGLFAMPSTLSLFAGQHTFYGGTDVKCEKCHQDIYNEISNTAVSSAHEGLPLTLGKCQGCHRTGTITNIPVSKYPNNGTYNGSGAFTQSVGAAAAHAAVTMECAGCHVGVPAELMDDDEAHTPFYMSMKSQDASNKTNILKGANEACVGCHTHIAVNITWSRSVGYNMTVAESPSGAYVITITEVNSSTSTTWSAGQ